MMAHKTALFRLPDELILHVFFELDFLELNQMRLTARKGNALVLDKGLWKGMASKMHFSDVSQVSLEDVARSIDAARNQALKHPELPQALHTQLFLAPSVEIVRNLNDWLRVRDVCMVWHALGEKIGLIVEKMDLSESLSVVLEKFKIWMKTHARLLATVKTLDLSLKKLSSLPSEIGFLNGLQELDLNYNQLVCLPKELGNLKSLQRLNLRCNLLRAVPEEIGRMLSLQQLKLDFNQLVGLPGTIGDLSSLQDLSVSYNNLQSVPSELGNLTAMRKLNLDFNQLRTLPDTVEYLKALEEFSLGFNPLEAMPKGLAHLRANLWLGIIHKQNPFFKELEMLLKIRSENGGSSETHFLLNSM